ncbi:MAG: quinone oxidoreductase [candidate division KSB1 bacterium]|nr:quinone oxidoreductase [candidate division KSB1 bacterium]MDZ7301107.1 quinone oxidoreductase [candidate division KSB1 bacterium]MDZ7312008.1 quinone oxidoreductase [candidate division KSB1 bacterium]
MKAIRIYQHGGAEVLKYEDVPVPTPGANEALVKIATIGVNFLDIYQRTGLYQVTLPFTPGNEAAGVVERVGAQVSEVQPGDRVAFAGALGAYAEYSVVPAWKLVPLSGTISFESAAAAMVQGMTAHYLTHTTFPLEAGHTCLVHAAAGGVGLLLIQIAKRLGARVIGTVSTAEKAQLAKEAGADEVILYTQQDFEAEVKRLTNKRGVEVVYDSVGKTTYEKSMNCLAPRGYLVLFGQSSGAVPPIDPLVLSAKGSLFLTRPVLAHHTATRKELLWRAGDLFNWIASGELKLRIDHKFPLAEAAAAHKLLESRQTTGKLLLQP